MVLLVVVDALEYACPLHPLVVLLRVVSAVELLVVELALAGDEVPATNKKKKSSTSAPQLAQGRLFEPHQYAPASTLEKTKEAIMFFLM